MKKKGVLTGLTALSSFLSISLISAPETTPVTTGQTNFEIWGETLAGQIAKLFDKIYLDPKNSSSILLGILLFMIIYSVLKNVRMFRTEGETSNFFWSGGVSLIVTLLALIYLPSNFLEMIGPQFGAMGGTILTMIPFIIMFYFTVWAVDSLVLARLSWLIFTIYYFIIFINDILVANAAVGIWSKENIPYFFGIIIGIIMFSFIYTLRKKFYREILLAKRERGERLVRKAATGAKILGKAADEFETP